MTLGHVNNDGLHNTMSENPDTLSLDGLRYKEQDYRLLMELSAPDIKKFLARNEASSEKIMDTLKSITHSLLHNPRLPDPMVANERINPLPRSLNDVVQESNTYQKRIDKLDAELQHERENNVFICNSAHPPPATLAPQTISVPDPECFGGNREKLCTFCSHLLMKLQGDSHRFPSDQHQLRYTIGLLTDQVFTQIEPYIKKDRIELASVTELLKVLEIAFGDPDRESTAEGKLEVLRQANRKFSPYYAEFQCYTADVQWNESAKRTALTRGLSTEIKDAMVLTSDIPSKFSEYATFLQRLDNRIKAREAEKKGRPTPCTTALARSTPSQSPTSPVAPVSSRMTDPMDLSEGRRGPLSQEEKAKRIMEGCCIYCGGLGHTVCTCTIRPLGGNEATLAPAPPLLSSSLAPAPATPFTQPVEKLGVLQAGDSACVGLPDSLSPFLLSGYSTTIEKEMEGYHMVVTCTLQNGQNSVETHALVDCGATGYAFIDENFAGPHNFPLFNLSSP